MESTASIARKANTLRATLIAFSTVLLGGCNAPLVILPDQIGERGLVLGEICSLAYQVPLNADPIIDERVFIGGLNRNHMTVDVTPGRYTFKGLNAITGGNTYFTEYTTYPMQLPFDVERGKATNLGLILVHGAPDRPAPPGTTSVDFDRPYGVIALDNSEEVMRLLRETRPQLYASLAERPILAAKASGDPVLLARVRDQIVRMQVAKYTRSLMPAPAYVSGCAGTLAHVGMAANGAATFDMLATDTLADLSACKPSGQRVACLISRDQYLSVNRGKIVRASVPAGITANTLQAVGNNGLVLIDDAMNVYTSRDDGAQWSKYTGAAFEKPLGLDGLGDPKNRFRVHTGANGFYVFGFALNGAHTRLLYGDYGTGELRQIALPNGISSLVDLHETRAGLVLDPEWTLFGKGQFRLLPTGSTSWVARDTPAAGCEGLAFPDDSGNALQVHCRYDKTWSSEDGGITWTPMFFADSLFAQ